MTEFHTIKPKTPIKAIRDKCLNCSAGHANEVKLCVVHDCPLYPYRFGRKPRPEDVAGTQWDISDIKKRHVSDEQRAAAAERLKKFHEQRRAFKTGPKTA